MIDLREQYKVISKHRHRAERAWKVMIASFPLIFITVLIADYIDAKYHTRTPGGILVFLSLLPTFVFYALVFRLGNPRIAEICPGCRADLCHSDTEVNYCNYCCGSVEKQTIRIYRDPRKAGVEVPYCPKCKSITGVLKRYTRGRSKWALPVRYCKSCGAYLDDIGYTIW